MLDVIILFFENPFYYILCSSSSWWMIVTWPKMIFTRPNKQLSHDQTNGRNETKKTTEDVYFEKKKGFCYNLYFVKNMPIKNDACLRACVILASWASCFGCTGWSTWTALRRWCLRLSGGSPCSTRPCYRCPRHKCRSMRSIPWCRTSSPDWGCTLSRWWPLQGPRETPSEWPGRARIVLVSRRETKIS